MSKLGKMVKDMVKTKKESVMGKLGDSPYEDPMEPWSVKYNQPVKEETLSELSKKTLTSYVKKAGSVDYEWRASRSFPNDPDYKKINSRSYNRHVGIDKAKERLKKEEVENLDEDSILYRYIRSKGYSPEHMDFAHRSAFARSRAFKSYKILHQKTLEKPQGGLNDIIVQKEEIESISEAGVGKLMNFIKAKGLDPTSMDGNQKKNYSGSSEYRVFKVLHPEDPKKQLLQDKKKKLKETSGMGERGEDWADATDEPFVKVKAKTKKLKEEADEIDTVTMDIPLLIRILEFAREDAKTDMDLHKVVENLIKMRGDGTLSMQSYAKIVAIKEHLESLEERELSAGETAEKERIVKGMKKGLSGFKSRYGSRAKEVMYGTATKLAKEEVEELSELSKETLKSYRTAAHKSISKAAVQRHAGEMGTKEYRANQNKRSKGIKRADDDKRLATYADKTPKNLDNSAYGSHIQKQYHEEVEELSELSKATLKSYVDKVSTGPSRGKTQTGTLKSIKAIGGVTKAIRKQYEKPVNELKKQADNMDFDDHLTREEVENITELANKTLRSYIRKTRDNPERKVGNDRALEKHSERMEKDSASGKEYHTLGSITRKLKKEETGPCWKGYMMVGSKMKGGKSVPNCVPSNRKNIVKSAAKKKIRESMYDWEKDDKGDNKKPNAKVIMKGGTTLTGKPRDTVEIEPVLKTRPNSASGGKPSV